MLTDRQQFDRRNAILRILRSGVVRRQSDLAQLLQRDGFAVTQSSISRDLRELGVLKAGGRYLLPPDEISRANGDFGALAQFVRPVRAPAPRSRSSAPPSARPPASPWRSTRPSGPKSSAPSPATTPSSSPRRQPRPAAAHRAPRFTVPHLRSHMTQTANAQRGASPFVLAYSGGLDTSFLVPWLAENYRRPIITVTVDTGGIDAARPRRCANARVRSAPSSITRSMRAPITSSRCCAS